MKVRSAFVFLALLVASGASYAVPTQAVPEPGTIELLAIGAVVGIAAAIRNRRK